MERFLSQGKLGRTQKLLSIVLIALLLLIAGWFLSRGLLLNWGIGKVAKRMDASLGAKLVVRDARFTGFSDVLVCGLLLRAPSGDTLAYVDSLHASPSLKALFLAKIRLKEVDVSGLFVQLLRTPGRNNISFLFTGKNRKKTKEKPAGRRNPETIFNTIWNTIFAEVPKKVMVRKVNLHIENASTVVNVRVPLSLLEDGHFSLRAHVDDPQGSEEWTLGGALDESGDLGSFKIQNVRGRGSIPLLESLFGMETGFKEGFLEVRRLSDQDVFDADIRFNCLQFFVKHKRIAPQAVSIGEFGGQLLLHADSGSMGLAPKSKFTLNKLALLLHAEARINTPRAWEFELTIPETSAQQFFESLPEGLFTQVHGVNASGKLSYHGRIRIDEKDLNATVFESGFKKTGFKLNNTDQPDLNKLNRDFIHTVYEKGAAVRSFPVGPENPSFTPLRDIHPLLQASVMTSEDGNFYYHGGFNEDAFRKSIAENYRKKKFARGGSTISMQLVKNVYLTRNKTIARKLEEALIVWLIESNRLVSKDRMLEVYFNIIEWGPGIYGIGEAAQYYFNKKPMELSLSESIFLAMIVPRPKYFYYYFNGDGTLKDYTLGYFAMISKLLQSKGMIPEEDIIADLPLLEIKGEARNLIFKTDQDSLAPLPVLDPEAEAELIPEGPAN